MSTFGYQPAIHFSNALVADEFHDAALSALKDLEPPQLFSYHVHEYENRPTILYPRAKV